MNSTLVSEPWLEIKSLCNNICSLVSDTDPKQHIPNLLSKTLELYHCLSAADNDTNQPESLNVQETSRSSPSSSYEEPASPQMYYSLSPTNYSSSDSFSEVPSPQTFYVPPIAEVKINAPKKTPRKRRARAPAPLVDHLFCHNCGETSTSEWRRGPDGYKSLCNACGIRYATIVKKEKMLQSSGRNVTVDMLLNNPSSEPNVSPCTSNCSNSSYSFDPYKYP